MSEFSFDVIQPGTVIGGRYEVIRLIGKNQDKAVYQAKNIVFAAHDLKGASIAIKILKPDSGPVLVMRLQNEANCLSRINHPNVVTIFDFGTTPEDAYFMTTEYIEGERLGTLLERGVLPIGRFLRLFGQACDALSAVHGCDLVHRNVTPSNFIITGGGTKDESLFLIDFALCKSTVPPPAETAKLRPTGEIIGTPYYMSPEQCNGIPLDHRADVYSLGCCMYEALAGSPPFQGADNLDTIRRHVNEPAPSLPEGNPELSAVQSVIARCLEKKPEDRFQSMVDVKVALVGTLQESKFPGFLRGIAKKKFWPFG